MKKNILTTLVAALVYFLCIGVGVLLGNLVDHTGNMFYAPAFSALVGGSVYMILLAKVPRFGAITTTGLVISLFFLGSKHGAGAFLPGIICGLAADGIAHLGHYKDKVKKPSFLPSFCLWYYWSHPTHVVDPSSLYRNSSRSWKISGLYRSHYGCTESC